ncbi:MAG TPA: flagellin [Candidatus Binatia bacterium]|nr:flagellin [Candidatus Binatia bacterium]
MGLVINTNVSALTAQRNLTRAQSGLERSIQRMSTGLRINGAVDDAAGLAISDRLTAQIRGLNQAVRNANDGVSALQTADGSLNEVSNLLQRARELSIQSANDSNSSSDRTSLNAEVSNILSELDRLASTVQFNNRKLLDGTFTNAQFQVGANAYETVSFSISSVNTADLGAITLAGVGMSSTGFSDLTSTSQMTINGITVTVGAQTTIEGVVNAINNYTGTSLATAKKNSQTIVTDTGFIALTTALATQTLTLNGVAISLTTGNAAAASTFMATVNGYSNQTGVVVTTSSTGYVYTRASGGTIAFSETTASVGVGDAVASTASRTFNAGFTLSVDLNRTLTVISSGVGDDTGFTTGVVNTTVTTSRINGLYIANVSGANDSIQTIDYALSQLSRVRGDIGAVQNRFSSAISSLSVASENLSAARSRIQDADVAQETAELTRTQILIQAGVAVLSQANQLPSVALSLLGGR